MAIKGDVRLRLEAVIMHILRFSPIRSKVIYRCAYDNLQSDAIET